MEKLPLFKVQEKKYFYSFIFLVFLINIYFQYQNYKTFIKDEVFKTDATIINIYQKEKYYVLKLKSSNFVAFTPSYTANIYKKNDTINIYLITTNITFLEYLKGFYTKSFNIVKIKNQNNSKLYIKNFIKNQHTNVDMSSLYQALFLAIPVSSDLREVFSNYGISHLIAISGFHLGIISFVLYFLLHIIYNPIHKKYIPYRNKRFDIMIVVTFLLFEYLILIDTVPSFLRAFIMFLFALFLLRNNIKLVSFETLLIVVLTIIALFPKLLFSLSLWFSVAGVFYIFLFIKYFNNINRYIQIFIFNFWIYFALNPIIHYFFTTTSYEQLISPILTILFTIFYPLVAILHILNIGWLFDDMLITIMSIKIDSFDIATPLWFFTLYLFISFLSIFYKNVFIVLNILFVSFNIYLFT
ncbi:MAG: ComEC/Rec2 family competence protein [Campylobacterota bacterium]|nr:ComEC/Rec2 family competence protein [Campylobacterota bacterium]